jgi:hypothetical protein
MYGEAQGFAVQNGKPDFCNESKDLFGRYILKILKLVSIKFPYKFYIILFSRMFFYLVDRNKQ